MRAVPWRLSVKESSRRPAEGSFSARLGFSRLHALEEDRRRVAKNERRAEAERPDQLGTFAPRRAAVRADARAVVLLAPERPVRRRLARRRRASRLFGRARSRGRPAVGLAAKRRSQTGTFSLPVSPHRPRRRPHPRPGHRSRVRCRRRTRRVAGCAAAPTGAGLPRSPPGTPRRIQSSLRPPGLALRRTGIRRRVRTGCVQRASPTALRALRIDAAPDAGNGALEGVKPDRCEALFLLIGRLSRRARHRKDEIGGIDTIGPCGRVKVRERHAPIEQSLDKPPCRSGRGRECRRAGPGQRLRMSPEARSD